MSSLGVQLVPELLTNAEEHRRQLARAVNNALLGRQNVTLDVTLTAGAATTTIQDNRISYYSAICPAMPMTASAATALAAGVYVNGLISGLGATPGQATIHHAVNAAVDQTIRFLIIGG